MKFLTFILIIILILTINQCFGKEITAIITKIVNFKITTIEDRKIYTGKVFWCKNNQPAKVRIMLIGTSTSTPYDEAITSSDGSFRLSTPKEVISLISVQPYNKKKKILLIPHK